MQKLLILSRPVFFVGMFLGSQLYGAAELGRYMMVPLAAKLRQEGSVVRQLGGKGFDFLGSRLSPGVHDMQQTILNFGSTHADALREAADSFQKGFFQTLEEHKDNANVQRVIDQIKSSARTLASMCVVAGSMSNLARNPWSHPLAKVWGSNGTKHVIKSVPPDYLVAEAEEGLLARPSSQIKKLQKMGIPVGAILDGTIAAAAAWGIARSRVLPTATLFAQTGLAGSSGASFIIKASGMHEAPAFVAPVTSMGMSFSIMSIIGGVQMMVDNCPEVKKLRYKPGGLQKFSQELKALESKDLWLTFLKRVASNAARTTRGPLAFIGGAGIVMCNVLSIADGFSEIFALAKGKSALE